MSPHPLDDAMAARVLVARWVIQGTLRLETAMHLGGERSDRTDMPILRDPVTGRPLLPGTTLAGALRNALADHLVGYGDTEPKEVAVLFGGARGDKDGSQSPLIVFDGLGELPPGYGVEIRDGVAIDPATGLAEDSKKYDYEVLPPGTLFPVRVDLLVPPDGADEEAGSAELRNLEYLAAALGALSRGEHSFGARRSRGLGTVRATWSAQRFPLDSRKGWLEWAGTAHEEPWPREPSHSCIREVLEKVMSMPLTRPVDARRRVVFELSVAPVNDILVRTPGTGPAEPDAVHLRSGGEPILPGTGLAGVMRAQALRIAKLVRKDLGDADYWISRLFGPRFQGRRPKPGHQASGSRLRVGEAALEDTATRRQTRVAIDRFTQGTVNGALFDEQIETGGHATLQLELRNPKEGEVGLVLLVLKDLLDGRLPVGGTSSVGRGFLHGTAVVTWHDGAGRPPRSARVEPGQTPIGEAADDINKAITALHEAAHLPEVNPPEHTTTSSRGRHMSDAEATAVQHIAGCTIEPIENADCEAYLSWLLGRKGVAAPPKSGGLSWALAHCDDGVTWGRYDEGHQVWRLGNQVAADLCPTIGETNLQELRLFGERMEVLIWKTSNEFRGRIASDLPPDILDEFRIIRGDAVGGSPGHSFTRITDRAGAEQVIPLVASSEELKARTIRLKVRHYHEEDPDTGELRIALSRLVDITTAGKGR